MRFTVILVLLFWATNAGAQTVTLTCSGTLYDSAQGMTPFDPLITVGPRATTLDFDQKTIFTPVGDFRISDVSSDSVYFRDDKPPYVILGTLDRHTGIMDITWFRAEEYQKLAANLSATVDKKANLTCTVSKRMF
jgi:hypothetical protein